MTGLQFDCKWCTAHFRQPAVCCSFELAASFKSLSESARAEGEFTTSAQIAACAVATPLDPQFL